MKAFPVIISVGLLTFGCSSGGRKSVVLSPGAHPDTKGQMLNALAQSESCMEGQLGVDLRGFEKGKQTVVAEARQTGLGEYRGYPVLEKNGSRLTFAWMQPEGGNRYRIVYAHLGDGRMNPALALHECGHVIEVLNSLGPHFQAVKGCFDWTWRSAWWARWATGADHPETVVGDVHFEHRILPDGTVVCELIVTEEPEPEEPK